VPYLGALVLVLELETVVALEDVVELDVAVVLEVAKPDEGAPEEQPTLAPSARTTIAVATLMRARSSNAAAAARPRRSSPRRPRAPRFSETRVGGPCPDGLL